MSYEKFVDKTFRQPTLDLIGHADDILREYAADGYTVSLRQLYYQFVSRGIIPNTDKSYKKLGGIVTDARLAGLLPWDGIEDRGRTKQGWLIQEDMSEILSDVPYQFAADFWKDQDRYIEVWVEKDALSSVVERAVKPLRVGYMACKGYLSASAAYRAGERFYAARQAGKEPLVIHLGDHDPSGLDMTRDNRDRLDLFSYGGVEVHRIALNMDQVDQYSPPPNPTKTTDSRADWYIAEHGHTSWELDALEPSVLVKLITDTIEPHIDRDLWQQARDREISQRHILHELNSRWDEVEDFLRDS